HSLVVTRQNNNMAGQIAGVCEPLSVGCIYDIVRARTTKKFGKAMGLNDFLRAAATFLAMDAPDRLVWYQECCTTLQIWENFTFSPGHSGESPLCGPPCKSSSRNQDGCGDRQQAFAP